MFLDILLGILWAVLVGLALDQPLTLLWLFCGVFFALLPDIDFWVEYFKRGTVGGKTLGDHRVLTHYPLLFVIPGILIFYFFGTAWGMLFTLGILGHFIHDATGMGYGYRLFYPFSPDYYKFFSDREGNISYTWVHFMVRWSEAEVRALHQKHGNDYWIRDDIRYHLEHPWHLLLQLLLLFLFVFILSFFFT